MHQLCSRGHTAPISVSRHEARSHQFRSRRPFQLEAIAGELPDVEGEEPRVTEREDGSLLIDGMMYAPDALDRLGVRMRPADSGFHTIAGFALSRLGHLPDVGEHFEYEGWRFEIVDMDGRRIDKLVANRVAVPPEAP